MKKNVYFKLFEQIKIRPLTVKDLPDLEPEMNPNIDELGLWNKPPTRIKDLLNSNIIGTKAYRRNLTFSILWMILRVIVSMAPPLLIYELVINFEKIQNDSTLSLKFPILLCFVLGGIVAIEGRIINLYIFNSNRVRLHWFRALNLQVAQKVLSSQQIQERFSSGNMLNLLSADLPEATSLYPTVLEFIHDSLVILVSSILVLKYLGSAGLVSLGLLLLLGPANAFLSHIFARIDQKGMNHRDLRISLLSQILSGIQVIKAFSLQSVVEKNILSERTHELASYRKNSHYQLISVVINTLMRTIVCFAGLGAFIWQGNLLTPATILACLSLFNLAEGPFRDMAGYLSAVARSRVSLRRIFEFLHAGENRNPYLDKPFIDANTQPINLLLNNISVRYPNINSKHKQNRTLDGITVEINAGKCIAIVGPVGSGKSTLIKAIIGELSIEEGEILFNGKFSACSPIGILAQDPFFFRGTLAENITFNSSAKLDPELLADCSLYENLGEILEGGQNLSGGQRQRLGLARTAYSSTNLIILDDPFSALDVKTEDQVFSRLIQGRWQGKTRIIATHRLQNLQLFDRVIFLVEGRVEAVGKFETLQQENKIFRDFYDHHSHQIFNSQQARDSEIISESSELKLPQFSDFEEERIIGLTGIGPYWSYFKRWNATNSKFLSILFPVLLIILTILAYTTPIVQDYWLSQAQKYDPKHFLSIYLVLGFITVLLKCGQTLLMFRRAYIAAESFHNKAFKGVLRAALRFFEKTPSASILNRFSRDQSFIDQHLPESLRRLLSHGAEVITTLAFVVVFLPILFLILPLILFVNIRLQWINLVLSRELRALEAVAEAPKIDAFREILSGLLIIRGFAKEAVFEKRFTDRLKKNLIVSDFALKLRCWYQFQVTILSAIFNLCIALASIYAVAKGHASATTVGLIVTYSIFFTWAIPNIFYFVGETQANITALERLTDYENLKPEGSIQVCVQSSESNYLSSNLGTVEFQNVNVRYDADLPLSLHNISFKVNKGERFGIIGKTGSGKSTILKALLRLIEVESGEIKIGEVPISILDIESIRAKCSWIPQNPLLFAGSLRANLDPFTNYSDNEIFNAVAKLGLDQWLKTLPGVLNFAIFENGQNISLGQRQLLCFARALLFNSPLILVDEATSNLDPQSQNLIHSAIRSMSDKTIIIVAHRPSMIQECDRLIELSQGRIITTPHTI